METVKIWSIWDATRQNWQWKFLSVILHASSCICSGISIETCSEITIQISHWINIKIKHFLSAFQSATGKDYSFHNISRPCRLIFPYIILFSRQNKWNLGWILRTECKNLRSWKSTIEKVNFCMNLTNQAESFYDQMLASLKMGVVSRT